MHLARSSFVLLAVILTACHAHYLKVQADAQLCSAQSIRMSTLNQSVLLESSQLVPKPCKVRVVRPPFADGLVVVVRNVSIDNAIHGGCDNYIQFGSSSETKWCQSSDARSLILKDTPLDVEFNLDNNSDYYFSMVVTAYKKSELGKGLTGQSCDLSASFLCRSSGDDQQLCISDDFQCDGLNNCPQGFDETNCSSTVEPTIFAITQTIATTSTGTTDRDVTQRTDEITKESTESTAGTTATQDVTERTSKTTEVTPGQTFQTTETMFEVTDASDMSTGIRTTFYMSDPNYETYNIKYFCNGTVTTVELEPAGTGTTVPAIIELTAEESQLMDNGTECIIQFTLPSSTFSNEKGLMIGIDSLNLISDQCLDYVELDFNGSPHKWCSNKTDRVGLSFKGEANDKLNVKFHAADHANSTFRLVVTQYQGKLWRYCPNKSDMKCTKSNNVCVAKTLKCDGHRNCPAGEDEESCTPTTTPQPTPTTTSAPNITTTSPTTTTASPTTTTSPPITTSTNPTPTTTTASPTSSTSLPPTTTTSGSTTREPMTSTTPSGNKTTSESPSTTPSSSSSSGGMSGGSIALTVIGVLVAVGLIMCALFMVRRRRVNVEYSALN